MNQVTFCCFVLFIASSIGQRTTPSPQRIKEYIKDTDRLEELIKDSNYTLLRTPEDVQDECRYTALRCFLKQPLKLSKLFEGDNEITTIIARMSTHRPSRNQNCKMCPSYPEKSVQHFLKELKQLLQKITKENKGQS
nr:PREDICTED: interleukin-21 [Latimeria chalumnae]|eukprot:XP_006010899.1 PREDICTED: interleukin-21 [Latimeria chalumnae]